MVRLHGAVEGAAQRIDAVAQDVGETHQHRQRQVRRYDLPGEIEQIDAGPVAASLRPADEVPPVVDVKVPAAPVGDVVGVTRLLNGPVEHAASIK